MDDSNVGAVTMRADDEYAAYQALIASVTLEAFYEVAVGAPRTPRAAPRARRARRSAQQRTACTPLSSAHCARCR